MRDSPRETTSVAARVVVSAAARTPTVLGLAGVFTALLVLLVVAATGGDAPGWLWPLVVVGCAAVGYLLVLAVWFIATFTAPRTAWHFEHGHDARGRPMIAVMATWPERNGRWTNGAYLAARPRGSGLGLDLLHRVRADALAAGRPLRGDAWPAMAAVLRAQGMHLTQRTWWGLCRVEDRPTTHVPAPATPR